MLDLNNQDLSFKTEASVEAYATFFLKLSPLDAVHEFPTDAELDLFNKRREILLKAQLLYLRDVELSRANSDRIEGIYHKIVRHDQKPLSSEGSIKSSSRFNYKEIPLLKNKVIYFGKTKRGCEIEKFHLEYQREMIKKAYSKDPIYDDAEIRFSKHLVKQFEVSMDNILILTSKPSWDAIGITQGTFMNEWYDLNEEFEIPTSSQILGTIARVHGFKGMLYKSIRHQIDSNLVIFEENAGELKFKELETHDYIPSPELIENS